jgi:hypothetical protein
MGLNSLVLETLKAFQIKQFSSNLTKWKLFKL